MRNKKDMRKEGESIKYTLSHMTKIDLNNYHHHYYHTLALTLKDLVER